MREEATGVAAPRVPAIASVDPTEARNVAGSGPDDWPVRRGGDRPGSVPFRPARSAWHLGGPTAPGPADPGRRDPRDRDPGAGLEMSPPRAPNSRPARVPRRPPPRAARARRDVGRPVRTRG